MGLTLPVHRRGRLLLRALLGVLALTVAAQVTSELALRPRYESDTDFVVRAAARALRCVDAGAWSRCPNLSRFPVLQHLPAAALLRAGATTTGVLRGLSLLSAAANVGVAAVLFRSLGGAAQGVAWLALAAWVGSFGLWYTTSTFGEPLAALVTLLAVWRCHRRDPGGALAAMWLAALSKEVAAPFLLALGGAALLLPDARGPDARATRRTLAACALGVIAGAGTNALVNVWRFGEPVNSFYLNPAFRVDAAQTAVHLLGQWVSPNGGVILFAPVLMAAVLVAAAARPHGPARGPRYVARGSLAVLLLVSLGFARWFSPMGWWAWGPRLLLPWLPSALLLALHAQRDAWTRLAARLGPVGYGALALALAALATANAPALLDTSQFDRFFVHNPACPGAHVHEDPAGHARYMRCLLFSPRSLWWPRLWPVAAEAPMFVLAYAGVLWAMLLRAAKGPPEAAAPSDCRSRGVLTAPPAD